MPASAAAMPLADRLDALADFLAPRNLPYMRHTAREGAAALRDLERALARALGAPANPAAFPPSRALLASYRDADPAGGLLPAACYARLAVLQTLCPTRVLAGREPDTGYFVVAAGREVEDLATGERTYDFGRGVSPEAAIDDDFARLTTLPPGRAVVVRGGPRDPAYWSWSGVDWRPLDVRPL